MSVNPYVIDGPAVISFSGGRTSGYMLRCVLNAGLRPDVHVMFANTGKERPETLDFVHECETRWNVPITWLEYERNYLPDYKSEERFLAALKAREAVGHDYPWLSEGVTEPGYRVVTYETASRNGEPFENLIDMVALPNLKMRLCTQEMKIRPIKKHMLSLGYTEWDNIVGIRADEPKRVARMRAPTGQRWENVLPLADAGVIKADVLSFWAVQPFDLQLPLDKNGDTYGGNCDICFLKSTAKRVQIATENPEWVAWWAEQERRTGMTFRPHGVRYLDLVNVTPSQCSVDDDAGDCVCHD